MSFKKNSHLLPYNIRKIWEPALYQGNRKTKNYFEGWYFKLISKNTEDKVAIIPGIALGSGKNDAHAFIQLIDGKNGSTDYFNFQADDFSFSRKSFEVNIGKNFFSKDKIHLDIRDDKKHITGEIQFKNVRTLPVTLLSPGIMGWYRFIPFMECYHGIVSLHHSLSGHIRINDRILDLEGGTGYTEKTWGQSFPSSWIWTQSNHFEKSETSFFFSLANIPWFGHRFPGFLCLLMTGNKIFRFATYTGAKIKALESEGKKVKITIMDRNHILKISMDCEDFIILHAPVNGMMDRQMSESMSAKLDISLRKKNGEVLFEGKTEHAAMDIAGDVKELVAK